MKAILESTKQKYGFNDWPDLSHVRILKRIILRGSDITGYTLLQKEGVMNLPGAYTSVYEKSDQPRTRVEVTVAPFPSVGQSAEYLAQILATETCSEARSSLLKTGIRIADSIGFAAVGSQNGAVYSTLFIRGNIFFQIRNIGYDDVDVTPFINSVAARLAIADQEG